MADPELDELSTEDKYLKLSNHTKTHAALVRSYYSNLVKEGFEVNQAMVLAQKYSETVMLTLTM